MVYLSKSSLLAKCYFILTLNMVNRCAALNSFIVSLQSDNAWSTDHWMTYNKKIVGVEKEFTVCHWEKLRYVSTDLNTVWSYCYEKIESKSHLYCWTFYHRINSHSAGRNVDLFTISEIWSIHAESLPYRHRQWNHICFSYSSIRKIGKLYYNGQLVKEDTEGNFTDFESGNSVSRSSFLIGQEPDIFEGGYDPTQLFNGEVSEVNMWNKTLKDDEVKGLADCSVVLRGNIIAWEELNFIVNKAKVVKLKDHMLFCKKRKDLVIFPYKQTFKKAKSLCDVHGGTIAVPLSNQEEKEIFDIVKTHEKSCLVPSKPAQEGKAVWLGIEKQNRKWYVSNESNQLELVNYTNWDPTRCTTNDCGDANDGCPYLQTDRYWAFGLWLEACSNIELCVICSFVEIPVFTLKGQCSRSLDWNYYFTINGTNQITGYDGYKTSKMEEHYGKWTFHDFDVSAYGNFDHPIGRKEWNYVDHSCEIKSAIKTSLTLSRCTFGEEFTCNSGQCIDMHSRCNSIYDCNDGSDEEKCDLVEIPTFYNKINPPLVFKENGQPVELPTRIDIVSVDVIDALNMLVGITFEIKVKWIDSRLTYQNLDSKGKNLISIEAAERLWLPCDNIRHDNAILGEVITDYQRKVEVTNLTEGMSRNPMKSFEDYIYKGSKAEMAMQQRFKIKYGCIFDLTRFPFDEHRCNFTMKLDIKKGNSIIFTKDMPSVFYHGPETVGQFRISNISSIIENDLQNTRYIFSLNIKRHVMNQFVSTFLPTAMVWSLAYCTLFIDIENFSDRFIGTVTGLLVLVSLLASVNNDLPKTSYLKFIDSWFLWYITNILIMIFFHIFLNQMNNKEVKERRIIIDVNQKRAKSNQTLRSTVNNVAIIIFPTITFIFVVIYFTLTT